MPYSSHIANLSARGKVRTYPADIACGISHNRNMARRGKPTGINWYLREWMDTVFPVARGRQAKMMELTGWSKATASQLYNNEQDYSPKLVNEAAKALNAEPWELLMPPERAMRLRRIQNDLIKLAHDSASDKGAKRDTG